MAERTQLPQQHHHRRQTPAATETQHTRVPTQRAAARLTARLATTIAPLAHELAALDHHTTDRFHAHNSTPILLNLPRFDAILGAAFLAHTHGELAAFDSPNRLATAVGLAPAPRDSGHIVSNHHHPRRDTRRLPRVR